MARPTWQERLTPYFRKLSSWLTGSTALSSPTPREWRSFGPAATMAPAPTVLDFNKPVSEILGDLKEAFQQVMDDTGLTAALQKVGASLRRKAVDSGPTLDVVKSRQNGREIAAVRVTPKLSPKGVDGLTGRSAALDARRAQQALTADRYRSQLEPFIESARKKTAPPFSNWDDLSFIVSTLPMSPRLGHEASGGFLVKGEELYIGAKVATAGKNPASTMEKMRRTAGELGIPLLDREGNALPPGPVDSQVLKSALSKHFMFDEGLSRGTDILLRDGDLLSSRQVDTALSLSNIETSMRKEVMLSVEGARNELSLAAGNKERQEARDMLEATQRQLGLCDYRGYINEVNARTDRRRQEKLEEKEPAFVPEGNDMLTTGFGSDEFDSPFAADDAGRPSLGKGRAGGEPDREALGPENVIIRMVNNEPQVYVSLPFGASEDGATERLATEINGVEDLPDGIYPVETAHEIPDGHLTLEKGQVVDRQGHKQVVVPEHDVRNDVGMSGPEGMEGPSRAQENKGPDHEGPDHAGASISKGADLEKVGFRA